MYDKAKQLSMLIDGISYLFYEDKNEYSPIVLGNLYNGDDELIHFTPIYTQHTFDVDFTINDANGSYTNDPVSNLIRLAKTEAFVLNILRMASTGMTFIGMYQCYDEINTFLRKKGDSYESLGFTSKKIDQFTHTANNFQATGISGRHGTKNQKGPTVPMLLSEAQVLITDVILATFRKYFNVELHVMKSWKVTREDLWEIS